MLRSRALWSFFVVLAQGGSSRVRSRSLDLSRPPPPGASTDWVTAHIAAQGTHHSSDVSSLVTASSQHLGCHPSPSGEYPPPPLAPPPPLLPRPSP